MFYIIIYTILVSVVTFIHTFILFNNMILPLSTHILFLVRYNFSACNILQLFLQKNSKFKKTITAEKSLSPVSFLLLLGSINIQLFR
jgi:hypothetical protein